MKSALRIWFVQCSLAMLLACLTTHKSFASLLSELEPSPVDKLLAEPISQNAATNGTELNINSPVAPSPSSLPISNSALSSFDADFDNDNDVDMDDLDFIKTGYSVDATGDTDFDGDSDGYDFLNWQRSSTMAGTSTAQSTPEPTSGIMWLGLLTLSALSRRTR